MRRIRDAVHADADEWGVSRRAADILLLLPFAGALLVVVAYAYLPAFRFLTDEDAVLEWLQVTCYVGTAIFAVLCARELALQRMPAWSLAYLVLAACCVFVVGEELAWGQRILGFGTPEALREINHQRETTVHNVGWLQDGFNVVLLIAGLYGLAVSWLTRAGRLPRWREFRVLAVPPLFLSSAFLVLVGYKARALHAPAGASLPRREVRRTGRAVPARRVGRDDADGPATIADTPAPVDPRLPATPAPSSPKPRGAASPSGVVRWQEFSSRFDSLSR